MILEMITSAYIYLGSSITGGHSETARYIDEKIRESRSELVKPDFYFSLMKKVLPELMEVHSIAAQAGWDGYGARPVTNDAYYFAQVFLSFLPNSIPAPTIGAEPDGQITFEWYRSERRTLSVSISPEGDVHYAALLGPNKTFGTEVFFGEMPKVVLDLISRVYAA
jgi:hypothetical protein